jgi:gamma-D-glutamyl-L-lysine dipeptidyl-peptidase
MSSESGAGGRGGDGLFSVAHNVVHLRAKAGNDSERVSQLRLGQTVEVLREENGWAWVQGEDTYRGWADKRWLCPKSELALTVVSAVFADLRAEPDPRSPLLLRLPLLTRVHLEGRRHEGFAFVTLPDASMWGWLPEAALVPLPRPEPGQVAERAAVFGREFLGTPYLWGGSSSFGLDCSGFAQYCYEAAGVVLRRDADIQRDDPRFVPVEQAELRPGDLVFFGKPDRITHVGMHFADGMFIHSAGGAGVIVTAWGDDRYSPGYVDARRLDPPRASEPVTRYESETR